MDIINLLEKSEKFAAIDHHFARFVAGLNTRPDPVLALAAALVCRSTREGDVCADLSDVRSMLGDTLSAAGEEFSIPDIQKWRQRLADAPVVGKPGEYAPLILDERDRLYLHRYWAYENSLVNRIRDMIENDIQREDAAFLKENLTDVFSDSTDSDVDWQKVAAALAAVKRFCVISGGPGTGKTHAIARILAVLIKLTHPDGLRITLTAPTGKAAARLTAAVQSAKKDLAVDAATLAAIPETSFTIHRLLKPIKGTPFFRHNSENRLSADVVIVDEASMVDLPLMSKLMQAVPNDARVILMGDRHQLASVEAGSILGDLCGRKRENGYSRELAQRLASSTGISEDRLRLQVPGTARIRDHLIYFTRNYRFAEQSGIHRLSQAVNAGDGDEVVSLLAGGRFPEVAWYPLESSPQRLAFLRRQIQTHYSRLARMAEPAEGLEMLERFRILCAVNQGDSGVVGLNALATAALQTADRPGTPAHRMEWYHGRPVLITANDYELDLFNGDAGIAVRAAEEAGGNHLRVCFAAASTGGVRSFAPARLPPHQSVYAMTIHKSQGSEFDEVLLVLPASENPLLSRELLYTGITRAKRNLSILATESVIRSAVSRRIERTSGLHDALWGEG